MIHVQKVFALLLICFLLALTAGGCKSINMEYNKNNEKKGQSQQDEKGKSVEIKVWGWEDNNNVYTKRVKMFNDTHSDIKVNFELYNWNDFYDRLLTAICSGNAPDASWALLGWMPVLIEMDAAIPLDGYIVKWDQKENIYDTIWNSIKGNYKNIYGLPHSNIIMYLYCRKDLFEKAGLQLPETIDEFYNAAEKLTMDTDGDGKTNVYGFGIRGSRGGHEMWAAFVMSALGGEFVDQDGQPRFNTLETVAANERYINLYKEGYAPPTSPKVGWPQVLSNLEDGIVAMTVLHVGTEYTLLEKYGDNITAVPVPRGKAGRWASMHMTSTVIYNTSEHRDEAFEFLSWSLTPEQNDFFCREWGQIPVNKVTAQDPYYHDYIFHRVSFDSLDFGHVFPANTSTAEWVESLWPATMQRALIGEITSQEMMDILEEGMTPKN